MTKNISLGQGKFDGLLAHMNTIHRPAKGLIPEINLENSLIEISWMGGVQIHISISNVVHPLAAGTWVNTTSQIHIYQIVLVQSAMV